MHGAVLLDAAECRVLRPCISCGTTRAARRSVNALAPAASPDDSEISRQPDYARLHRAESCCWVAEHEPEIFRRIDKVLLPKDYLRWRLTGRFVS